MNTTADFSNASKADTDWWRGAVIYQVYPRSFQDSNGDGIGDLLGIAQRMPHIASLGVDAVWISPFFTSPMRDFGYDVSDYCDVDPMFGTLADFDTLIAQAHRLGVKVLIDLVLSHTSMDHPWFVESRSSKDNPKANWYVWADAKPDGTPPNNWLSIFGGSAWQWDPTRCQYYLHNFLTEQPDLNFHEPEVQSALMDVATFWLDRGVDGFRLDTINFYVHDKQLRDNPPLPEAERNPITAPAVNPYTWQNHLYDKTQPENLEFLRKLRALMNKYNAAAVGEVGDDQRGLEILGEYTGGSDLIHMSYAFELLSDKMPTAPYIAEVFEKVEAVAANGWACWAFSNHDVPRHASRWKLTEAGERCFATLMQCLRGSTCLYQGEELGLPEADVAFEDLQDPYGKRFWPAFKGRDGCRTPMVWEPSNQNGGFSSGRPWLPVSHDHLNRAVAVQEQDPSAILHHYRRVIAFRHAHDALRKGTQSRVEADGSIIKFQRSGAEETIFCAFNLSNTPSVTDMPEGEWLQIGIELGSAGAAPDGRLHLGPWQPALMMRADAKE
ncbi:Oligo-1,6-glucosidase [Roseivivax sp. THAF40]|uniref:alpha-amylase family glycosyl hydrolase n=1 Tax=unclassified Roseivivax TaxID=2639302 RepID=UPI0012697D62|nr:MULTISPECIES: alpha-amylase family glycosyl hydrolase [unclassified Roseivivax]QFS83094.1 Oligo-1,6-glucosidase [Roseivivax sp. THAF197b]QFT46838.1 Oligo-1,6-glucosidase [Roseivivax sp. THAF40]